MQEFKIRVVNGNQREIQDALFAAGYAWRGQSHKEDGKYGWPLAIGYTAGDEGSIRACMNEGSFYECGHEEFVLRGGKFVKKEEPVKEVIPESVRRACRTELADQLHKASRALKLGEDPSIETWEAIFELKEFLTKP
jgi:hypothetical protein